jgi:general secretion pathway protein I
LQHRRILQINGFTLLEVMVALAIFSLAALALIRLQAYSMRSGGDVIAHDLAWQVARNRAAELLSDPLPPVLGSSSGQEKNGGRIFNWRQDVKKTDDVRVIQIDVFVNGDGGGKAVLKLARPITL